MSNTPPRRSWEPSGDLAEAAEAFEEPFGATIEARARAIAPVDRAKAEPNSREWYAVEILRDIEQVRAAIAAGDARLAAGRALQLGVMARTAEFCRRSCGPTRCGLARARADRRVRSTVPRYCASTTSWEEEAAARSVGS